MAAEGPIFVILDMISLLIENTVGTMMSLLGLSGDLMGSLSLVMSSGGLLGMVVAFAVLLLVGFFLLKIFFGSVKTVAMLALAGVLLLVFILVGLSIF